MLAAVFLISIFLYTGVNTGNTKIRTFRTAKKYIRLITIDTKSKSFYKKCDIDFVKKKVCGDHIHYDHIVPLSFYGQKFNGWSGNKKCKKQGRKCARKFDLLFKFMESDAHNIRIANAKYNIDKSDKLIGQFNPPDDVKGDVARIYMYMSNTYPDKVRLTDNIFQIIKYWDIIDPVNKEECIYVKSIGEIQGNDNEFVMIPCQKNNWW